MKRNKTGLDSTLVYPVADGHCDTMRWFLLPREKYDFARINEDTHVDLPRLKEGGVKLQFFALCLEPEYKPRGAVRRALEYANSFFRVLHENREHLRLIYSAGDLEDIHTSGQVGALLSLEGGEPLEGSLDVLDIFYRLGFRAMGLTWNDRNELADGVGVGPSAGGLTKLGKEVVRRMNRLGMIVDAAHLAPRSFYDVLELCASPVLVSHANIRTLCAHPRNLDDDQLWALKEKGGVIGLSFYPPFIREEGQAKIEHLLDHFCYVAEKFGVQMLGIGSDFDGIDRVIPGLDNAGRYGCLAAGLKERGFTTEEIKNIMGGNIFSLVGKVLKQAGR